MFETAVIAAGTGTTAGLDDHMTGLSGCTGQSCIQMMIQNNPRTDTCMNTDMDQIFMIFHKGFFGKGGKICFIFQPYRNLQSVLQRIFDGKVCKVIIWSEGDFIPADGTVDTDTYSHNTKGGGGKKTDLIPDELDTLRGEMAQWSEQEEDVLTYALFPQVATDFFKYREAQEKKVDPTIADAKNKAYPV